MIERERGQVMSCSCCKVGTTSCGLRGVSISGHIYGYGRPLSVGVGECVSLRSSDSECYDGIVIEGRGWTVADEGWTVEGD